MVQKNRKKQPVLLVIFLIAAASAGIFLFLREKRGSGAEKIVPAAPAASKPVSLPENDVREQPEIENAGNNIQKQSETPLAVEIENKKDDGNANNDAASGPEITSRLVGWGFQAASGRKIDAIIVHTTYNAVGGDPFSLDKILDIYKSYGVSPHYIIDRSGKIFRLTDDKNIAYHAGESLMPDGRTGVNNFSLGIEVINSKTASPTSAQYAALNELIKYLKSKYSIKYIVGHSQIAPGRKDDPWRFDWAKIK